MKKKLHYIILKSCLRFWVLIPICKTFSHLIHPTALRGVNPQKARWHCLTSCQLKRNQLGFSPVLFMKDDEKNGTRMEETAYKKSLIMTGSTQTLYKSNHPDPHLQGDGWPKSWESPRRVPWARRFRTFEVLSPVAAPFTEDVELNDAAKCSTIQQCLANKPEFGAIALHSTIFRS